MAATPSARGPCSTDILGTLLLTCSLSVAEIIGYVMKLWWAAGWAGI